MPNKYDLILFDMDGTIANTDELVVETIYEMYDLYRGGRKTPREQCYYFSGPPLRDTVAKEFPGGDVDFLVKEFGRLSKDKYAKLVTPYPNSREVKLKLKEMGIKLGVVTNKAHDMAMHCLDVIGLNDVFEILIGSSDVKSFKPSPEGIYKAMEALGVKDKKRVLYVGDNALDDQTAKNAGIDSCLVTWGPRILPDNIHPTYKIDNYFDLLEVIEDEN